MFIYDCEIVKAISSKNEEMLQGIEYCKGWQDHENMGLSVVCGYDYNTMRFRVFMKDNFGELQMIFEHQNGPFVGFNNIGFDNKLLRANGIEINDSKCYDILKEIWVANGLGPEFEYPSHIGYGLDAVLNVNFPGIKKSGHGALAPVQWQRKQYAQVVDYCLEDIRLTKKVLDKILTSGKLVDPVSKEKILIIPRP